MSSKVAVVTGSSQGLGLGIIRGLCKRFDGVVYLTSLYEDQGADAVAALEKEGLHPRYHQLDISNRDSIIKFRDHIKENHGCIDILINNAAISFKRVDPTPLAVQAEETLRINYFSTLLTCEILFPLLRNGARVVNIASDFGHLSYIPSDRIRRQLIDPNLSIPKLSGLMKEFVDRVKEGTNEEWGYSPYVISKAGVIAMTRVYQREQRDRDIKINAVHPGFVRTALAGFRGNMSPDEGADTPLYLVLDAPDTVGGAFVWWDRRIVDFDGKLPDNPTKLII